MVGLGASRVVPDIEPVRITAVFFSLKLSLATLLDLTNVQEKSSGVVKDVANSNHDRKRHTRTHKHSPDSPSLRYPPNRGTRVLKYIRLECGIRMARAASTSKLGLKL